MHRDEMRTLKSFSPSAVTVRGSIERKLEGLALKFALADEHHEVQDTLSHGAWPNWPRADELWKTTCFEAFLAIPGETGYWELNLSPSRKCWNLYHFESYRLPQPPHMAEDFELSKIQMSRESLECLLLPAHEIGPLEVSLSAVIRNTKSVDYFALEHAALKPDFHLRETFVWKI